ncbi:hypothetical protein ACFQ46_22720 [Kineococcus sp. GCM10028916]|uniref:hypothetical protein n=1 Tax=Kineococcus sp. GCM10028916 TaxID=3273394 RepID=UPI0036453CAE
MVPTLPALRVSGAVERISAHLVMPGGDLTASPANARPVLQSLQITYPPSGSGWEEAPMWPIVQEGGSVVLVMAQDADPRRRKTWPQRFPGRGDGGGEDYAVVVLAGCEVGVQVDVSGVVHLAWLSPFKGRVFRMALLTRRGPQAALELAAAGGLLT